MRVRVVRCQVNDTAPATLALMCGKNDRDHNEVLFLTNLVVRALAGRSPQRPLLPRATHPAPRHVCRSSPQRPRALHGTVAAPPLLYAQRPEDPASPPSCSSASLRRESSGLTSQDELEPPYAPLPRLACRPRHQALHAFAWWPLQGESPLLLWCLRASSARSWPGTRLNAPERSSPL